MTSSTLLGILLLVPANPTPATPSDAPPAPRSATTAGPTAEPTAELTPGPAAVPAMGDAQESSTADLPDRRRILHLDGGAVVRGRTRRVAGAWERRQDRAWVPVPGTVDRHRLEREVLAESRARRADFAVDAPKEGVALARWMGEMGLAKEALLELDRVLDDAPDHAGALALARDPALAVPLPTNARVGSNAWIRVVMREGAGGSPARREQCVGLLQPLVGRDGFEDLLRTGMTQPNDQHREFALLAARRLVPGRLCEDLARRAILDTMPDVRLEAARGLRDAKDPSWIGPAVRALDSEYDKVRSNAAEALGTMGYAAAVEPLALRLSALAKQGSGGHVGGTRANLVVTLETAYVQDFDVEIATGASIADPQIQTVTSGVIFDVRAQAQRTVVVEWRAVVGSLQQLTGADPGRGAKKWLGWWERNQGQWRAKDHLPDRTKSEGATERGATEKGASRPDPDAGSERAD